MADQIHRDLPDSELHQPKGYASSTTNQVPTNDGTTTTWKLLTNANVDAAAAISGSKLDLTNSVGTSDLETDSVTTSKIATDAVLTDAIKIRTDSYPVNCGSDYFDLIDVSATNGSIITWSYEPDGGDFNATVTIILSGATTYARVFYPSVSGAAGPTGETGTLYITYIANS